MDVEALVETYRRLARETAVRCQKELGAWGDGTDLMAYELGALTSRIKMLLETIDRAARLETSAAFLAAELVAIERQREEMEQEEAA